MEIDCNPYFQSTDSAYIFVGNLDKRLTEGDVITIFSQYGEIMDINLPRIPEGGLRHQRVQDAEGEARMTNDQKAQNAQQQQQNGKPGDRRGFGFILFEDQRSTILAVDNLNGFQLLNRTLRVDHVRDYKMPKRRNEDGEVEEPAEPSRNAAPQILQPETGSTSRHTHDEEVDMEDPMAAYIARSKSVSGEVGEDDKEERKRRKEQRRVIREERERRRQERVSRDGRHDRENDRYKSERHSHRREREHSPKYPRTSERYESRRSEDRDSHRHSHHSSNRSRRD